MYIYDHGHEGGPNSLGGGCQHFLGAAKGVKSSNIHLFYNIIRREKNGEHFGTSLKKFCRKLWVLWTFKDGK